MRGEDAERNGVSSGEAGSPPHARGRRSNPTTLNRRQRITPACAGKTAGVMVFDKKNQDHPRMRGEDRLGPTPSVRGGGSPPHARGRHHSVVDLFQVAGITPACAGKTRTNNVFWSAAQDHPRMRGEDFLNLKAKITICGSPPHARGRLNNPHNTVMVHTDHPRMRGEDCKNNTTLKS